MCLADAVVGPCLPEVRIWDNKLDLKELLVIVIDSRCFMTLHAVITFHIARNPTGFFLPGHFQVVILLTVAFWDCTGLSVSEVLCLWVGVPTNSNI